MFRQVGFIVSNTALVISLSACGGSGGAGAVGGGLVSSPAPPPSPPANDTSVELVAVPADGELSVVGMGDPIRIRYDAGTSRYEVLTGGEDWTALIDDPSLNSTPNMTFIFASRSDWPDGSRFDVQAHHRGVETSRYRYSNMAQWELRTAGPMEDQVRSGIVAVGLETPAGGVPVLGTGTYAGRIQGVSDATATSGWGDMANAPVSGSVSLSFDFGSGFLSGQIVPNVSCDCDPIDFPILSFTDTVFAPGSRTYSGRFETDRPGANSFSGLFTGPNAEETIGQWVFPFVQGGATHSASGAWIAKSGQ